MSNFGKNMSKVSKNHLIIGMDSDFFPMLCPYLSLISYVGFFDVASYQSVRNNTVNNYSPLKALYRQMFCFFVPTLGIKSIV